MVLLTSPNLTQFGFHSGRGARWIFASLESDSLSLVWIAPALAWSLWD